MTITLGVVDDEPLWRDLLRVSLTSGGMHVVAAFGNPIEAEENWPGTASTALIDVELGAGAIHGFELARRLRSAHPHLSVVFLTSVVDPWMVDEAAASLIAGTSYLLKRSVSSLEQLQAAVRSAAAGSLVVDERIIDALAGRGPVAGLTAAQLRLLRLMAVGKSNSQIAKDMKVAVKTVEGNITRIARVLGVADAQNVRVGCVTRYLSVAAPGAHRVVMSP